VRSTVSVGGGRSPLSFGKMKSSLRVLAWLIGIPLGLALGVMLLSLVASVIPSKAKRSLPREMSDVREFTSSYGFDSDHGLTAKGQLSAEQFWGYAETLGFTRDDQFRLPLLVSAGRPTTIRPGIHLIIRSTLS